VIAAAPTHPLAEHVKEALLVAVSGSKFTCRYKRSSLVRIASDVVTYSNGIVA
jgi:hypothetical protein